MKTSALGAFPRRSLSPAAAGALPLAPSRCERPPRERPARCRITGFQTCSSTFLLAASIVAILLPTSASAQVVISEFLYDADGSDTDQEFVELFNAGSTSVDLSGWKINDGSNHTLNAPPKNGGMGSITLAPGAYALLVDDAANFLSSHPGIHVSIIDTVLSLTNTGGTLSLINDTGTTIDSVSYTKDQGGAGDGNSLTRESVTSTSFSAGAPSPGTGTLSGVSAPVTAATDQTTSATSTETSRGSGAGGSGSPIAGPEPELSVDAGGNKTVIIGVDTTFSAKVYTRKKVIVDSAEPTWNFGDGSTIHGRTVLHRFQYPGKYAVVISIQSAGNVASDKIIVTAEQPKFIIEDLPDGSVSIENHAGRDVDLSRWIIRQSGADFVFPDQSILLAGASMKIPHTTLGFWSSSSVELRYPEGSLAMRTAENPNVQTITSAPVSSSTPVIVPSPVQNEREADTKPASAESLTEADPLPEESSEPDTTATTSVQVAAAAAINTASPSSGSSTWWWLGAFGVAGLAAGSLVVARKFGKKEWDIEEMSETR